MRRAAVSLALLLLIAASPAAYGVAARTGIPEGMCSLWTTKQASSAMKEQMEVVRDDPAQCVWYSKKDHNGNISTLSASLWGGDPSSSLPLLEQARSETWRNWTSEEMVAGIPVLMTDIGRFGKNREITAAAFPDDATWLDLNAMSVIGKDVRKAVRRMVELAAPKLASTAPSMAPAPSGSPGTPEVDACALLTEEEVSAALGEALFANEMPLACLFAGSPASGSPTSLAVAVLRGDEAASATAQFEGLGFTELAVGGVQAHQSPPDVAGGRSRSTLAVLPDPSTVLVLTVDVPEAIDSAAAVRALAELAIPRFASAPVPSTAPVSPAASVPAPSAAARTGIAALFPTEIGGRPVTIDRKMTGREFLSQIINFEPMEDRVTKALKRRDRTVGDLSFALGGTGAGSVIAAFQVEGGPIRPLVNVLLESLAMERSTQEVPAASVAGKDAFGVSGGFLIGGQGIAYPEGEVLWLVFPVADEQAEIFQKLP